MLETLASWVEAGALSQALRASVWLYPLVNTAHVVGIALLFGAIAPLDLRLLGCWRTVPPGPLLRTAVPVSVAGLVLALSSGALLFLARPLDYVREPLFGMKMVLLALAVLNALALRRSPAWQAVQHGSGRTAPRRGQAAALASLLLWLAVITAGRLIGYR